MEKHIEESINLFDNYNCCQSVVGVYGPLLGVDKTQILSMTAGFGAGMAYQGKTCGAVVGAYLCMGLIAGKLRSNKQEQKEMSVKLIQGFNQEFAKHHQHTDCKDLLGIDVSEPGNLEIARSNGLFNQKCPKFVETASRIVNTMIKENHLEIKE